jgi:hypothetical protein
MIHAGAMTFTRYDPLRSVSYRTANSLFVLKFTGYRLKQKKRISQIDLFPPYSRFRSNFYIYLSVMNQIVTPSSGLTESGATVKAKF